MKKRQSLLAVMAVALFLVLVLVVAGLAGNTAAAVQTYTLDWSVLGGGGSAGDQLSGTLGQTAIGWSTGAHLVGSGFW